VIVIKYKKTPVTPTATANKTCKQKTQQQNALIKNTKEIKSAVTSLWHRHRQQGSFYTPC